MNEKTSRNTSVVVLFHIPNWVQNLWGISIFPWHCIETMSFFHTKYFTFGIDVDCIDTETHLLFIWRNLGFLIAKLTHFSYCHINAWSAVILNYQRSCKYWESSWMHNVFLLIWTYTKYSDRLYTFNDGTEMLKLHRGKPTILEHPLEALMWIVTLQANWHFNHMLGCASYGIIIKYMDGVG